MRCCHFGDRFSKTSDVPSGSYICTSTNMSVTQSWPCKCRTSMSKHATDWHGRDEPHTQWRQHIILKYTKKFIHALKYNDNFAMLASQKILKFDAPLVIPDNNVTPLPQCNNSTFLAKSLNSCYPTDARIKQKDRLTKLKDAGLKPKKRNIYTEPGQDDCGDDISGLGCGVHILGYDYVPELFSDDEEETDALFADVPYSIQDGSTNIYSAVAQLCYGKYNTVDLLELCGGAGRISQVAFTRGLSSGGNIDLTTGCDLSLPETQRAINHYLKECNVLVVVLQPNCRTVGSFAPLNKVINPSAWRRHHQENIKYGISFLGKHAGQAHTTRNT